MRQPSFDFDMNGFALRAFAGLLLAVLACLGPAAAAAETKAADDTAAMQPTAPSDGSVPLCTLPLRPRERRSRFSPRILGSAPVSEAEPNNTQATSNFLDFGSSPGSDSLDVSGALTPPIPGTIPQSEDDGSIPLANPTGLALDQVVAANASIGDGPYGTTSGDYDFYEIAALSGQRITIDINAEVLGSQLDSYIGIYSSAGVLLGLNDDAGGATADSFLTLVAPATGSYFVVVRGFGTGFQTDPFDAASGRGEGSIGDYEIEIELGSASIDFFSFALNPGDIVGANLVGSGARLSLRAPGGAELVGSAQDVTTIYPSGSPLPGGGTAALSWVANTAGTYAIAVSNGSGSYTLQLRAFRPALENEPMGARQILFLDFDGASVDASQLGSSGVRTLSPLSSFLSRWGLSAGDEDAVIDAIVATVHYNFEVVGTVGQNGDFASSGIAGEYAVDIRNSRDDAPPWGQPNVTRIVVGGTVAELGLNTIGVSEAIDVGNFARVETAVILLDHLSDPNINNQSSLNRFPIDPSSTIIHLIGIGVGNAVTHEAGHLFGSFHTDRFNLQSCLMDAGGNVADVIGIGSDGIFATEDDVDVDFAVDVYAATEGFSGTEDTVNVNAFGLSTGTGPMIATPTPTATPTLTNTPPPGSTNPPTATRTLTPTRTPTTPIATATKTATPTPPPPGVCASAPRGDCRKAARSALTLRAIGGRPDRNQIRWKWLRGKAELDDLGTPLVTTSYDLCLYDAGGLRMTVTVPAGGTCSSGQPCWRSVTKGFVYRDTSGTHQGVGAVLLRSGDGRAGVKVNGRGAGMPLPALPLFVPVTVQLVSSEGVCWTAEYTQLGGDNLGRIVGRSTFP